MDAMIVDPRMLMPTAVQAEQLTEVLHEECTFSKICKLDSSECHSFDGSADLSVWKHQTPLLATEDDPPVVLDHGFEQVGGYATLSWAGKQYKGDAWVGKSLVVWSKEMDGLPVRFSVQSANFDFLRLTVQPGGEAELIQTADDSYYRVVFQGQCRASHGVRGEL